MSLCSMATATGAPRSPPSATPRKARNDRSGATPRDPGRRRDHYRFRRRRWPGAGPMPGAEGWSHQGGEGRTASVDAGTRVFTVWHRRQTNLRLRPDGKPSACEALRRRDAHDWLISAGEVRVNALSPDTGESGFRCHPPSTVANEPHSSQSEREQGGGGSSLSMRSVHVSPVLHWSERPQVRLEMHGTDRLVRCPG